MKLWLALFATSLSFPLCGAQSMAFQAEKSLPRTATAKSAKSEDPAKMQAEEPEVNQRNADGQINFTFQDQEWSEVIPWFSDQAGFSLQNVERWPAGTFNLQDNDSYSSLEALDQLNRSLAGLKEPFTLIRKRKMLMLKPVNEAIRDELIDSVNPADLDQRGAFEIMSVMFDLGELDGDLIYDDLKSQVSRSNQEYFNSLKASNQLQVRETGARLRNIRDIIETAKKKLADEKPSLVTYKLKFQDAETFTAVVGAQLGIAAGKVSNKDGTISIISEPLSNRLYVSGTKRMLDRFAMIAETVDSDPNMQEEDLNVERPFLRTYPITVDPKLAYDLLGTMLEGSDARMQQDEVSGSITVLGRKEDHARVAESLASVSDIKSKNFAIIVLEKVSVTEALGVLQSIYRQSTSLLDEGPAKGPVMLANTYLNQIIVSGTAKEVAEVRTIAEELDARYVPTEAGPRTTRRMVIMSEDDQMRLAPALGDLLGSKGRSNPFNVIRPAQRKDLDGRIRRGELQDPMENRSDEQLFEEMLDGVPSKDGVRFKRPARMPRTSLQNKPAGFLRHATALAFLALGAERANLVSNMMLLQQVSGDGEDGETETSSDGLGYRGPAKKKSVPGAPIQFRFTEYGLAIESDDLDAADDMEDAIADFLGESTEVQLPSFFELQHRSVQEMQQMLEAILGLSDGGAGGGDGGNPLGGMMSNMLPGGDLFDGLLGGVGGSDAVSGLEGDVTFGADVRFNTLWVTGATANDLSQINNLIEYWDRSEGETKPELFGKTRMIKVYYRDVIELVELIKAQRPEMIYNEQTAKQSGQGGGEVAQMMKAVQTLTAGKNKGGGGGGGDTGMKQTVVLNADTANSMILVTGPEYMYEDIKSIVEAADVAPGPRVTEVIPGVPPFLLGPLLQMYPGKLMMAGDEESSSATAKTGATQGNKTQDAAKAQAKQQLQRAIQQSAKSQQGGGGGGGRTGGGGGGGGGRTGGGGGGRTGGGGGGGGGRGGR